MKNFIINALIGAVAVQGVSVDSMSQRFSSSRNRNSAGEALFIRCPWTDSPNNRVHDSACVHVSGFQPATTDNDTEGLISWWFSLEGMRFPNNTLRAFLYEATGSDLRNAVRKCQVPTPTPTFIQSVTYSTSDNSYDAAWQNDKEGADFSMWANNDKILGVGGSRSKYIWHIQAHDKNGQFIDVGCCALEVENSRSMVDDYVDNYGPMGLYSVPELYTLFNTKQKEEWCMLQKGPNPPATDINVVDAMTTITKKQSNLGTETLTNATINAISPTEQVIPKIQSIAPVTATTGFCAGMDLVYFEDVDEDQYQPGLGSNVGSEELLLNHLTIKTVRQLYSSPDQQDETVLAFKWIIDRDETTVATVTCGRFQEQKKKNMICNDYSSFIGMDGMTRASDGAITEATAYSIPVFGGVGINQGMIWAQSATWFETLIPNLAQAGIAPYTEDIAPGDAGVTVETEFHPIIQSIETFARADNGACGQIIVTYKNSVPAGTTITYNMDNTATLAAGVSQSYTATNDYLAYVEASADPSAVEILALRFYSSLGSTLDCGVFQTVSASIVEPSTDIQTDPIPVIFSFETNNGSIGGVTVHTVDYDTVGGEQRNNRNNN